VAAAGVIMILLGIFPKIAALVAAIPPPVLGGAATILFATVSVVGIQTLARVDFHEERNAIILAVSLGLAMIPVAFPNFYKNFPPEWRIIVGNSITMGSLAAILLNLFFNVLTGKGGLVEEVTPTPRLPEKIPISQVNRLARNEFVDKVGRFFQGGTWIAEAAWEKRPFHSIYELCRALQETVFGAPPGRQLELIRSYLDLGRKLKPETSPSAASVDKSGIRILYETMQIPVEGLLGAESLRDQSSAGLDRLSPEEYYVRTIRRVQATAFLTLAFAPGECAQVDWGTAGSMRVGSTTRWLSARYWGTLKPVLEDLDGGAIHH
jgi:uric acid transporter